MPIYRIQIFHLSILDHTNKTFVWIGLTQSWDIKGNEEKRELCKFDSRGCRNHFHQENHHLSLEIILMDGRGP